MPTKSERMELIVPCREGFAVEGRSAACACHHSTLIERLGFPVVIVPDMSAQYYPPQHLMTRTTDPEQLEDLLALEQRLLYLSPPVRGQPPALHAGRHLLAQSASREVDGVILGEGMTPVRASIYAFAGQVTGFRARAVVRNGAQRRARSPGGLLYSR